MAQTLVNVRMDEEVKKKMEETCKELGITMSTAFNIFARKMSRERRIPFEVSIDPFYSESNKKAIEESIQQLKNKKVIYEDFGEMIFTHFGVSGPIILSGSAHLLRYIKEDMKQGNIKLYIKHLKE